MNQDEISQLLKEPESEQIEKTSQINFGRKEDKDKLCSNVCAFANDVHNSGKNGYFIIGLDDKTGKRKGLKVDDEMIQKITGIIRNNGDILPIPIASIQVNNNPDGDIIIIEVSPSDSTPVTYKKNVYILSGATLQQAGKQEIRRLEEKNELNNRHYELRPCSNAALSDLNIHLFLDTYLPSAVTPEIIAVNNRTINEKLASLHFWNLTKDTPTNLGIWVLG